MRQQIGSMLLRDRALSLGVLSGLLTSMAGLVGYIGVPVLTGAEKRLLSAATSAGFHMSGHPLWYHGFVLVLPSFVVALVCTLLLQRWGMRRKTSMFKLIGTIIVIPLLVIVIAYFVTAFAFGAMTAVGTVATHPLRAVGNVIVFTGFALIFGMVAISIAIPIVAGGVSIGSLSGVLFAQGFIRVGVLRS